MPFQLPEYERAAEREAFAMALAQALQQGRITKTEALALAADYEGRDVVADDMVRARIEEGMVKVPLAPIPVPPWAR